MNEWIEKARGGDASAMDYLIDKYREIGNEKEAAYWQAYRDAADSAIASMNRLSEIAETAEAAMALGLFDAAEEGFEKALPIRKRSVGIFNPGKKCGIVGRNIGYAASFSLGISTAPMAL